LKGVYELMVEHLITRYDIAVDDVPAYELMVEHPAHEHHKKAAEHYLEAAKYHELAAAHYAAGNHAAAAEAAYHALGHHHAAFYHESEAAKAHATHDSTKQ